MKLTIRIESEEGDGAWPAWCFQSIVDEIDREEIGQVMHEQGLLACTAALRVTTPDVKVLKEQ